MFGKKAKMLEIQVHTLERQLTEEKNAHRDTQRELRELQSRIDLEERTLKELQSAIQQKIKELDDQKRQLEYDSARSLSALQEDIRRQTEELETELDSRRETAAEDLRERVKAFGSNYSYYLAQLAKAVEKLSDTALRTAEATFSGEDVDVTELFRAGMGDAVEMKAPELPAETESEEPEVDLLADPDDGGDDEVSFEL